VAFCLTPGLHRNIMVATRTSARLREKREGLEEASPTLDTGMETEEENKAVKEVNTGEEESSPVEPSSENVENETEILKSTEAETQISNGSIKVPQKNGSDIPGYMKGFAKRVVLCTILVFLFKSVWPQVQNTIWPEEPVKEGKLYILSDKSFKHHVKTGDHLVMFYAPWCGHCKKLKPTWDKLAKKPGVNGVQIAKLDCTANEAVCKEYDVTGYPTILYFRDSKKIDAFSGAKSMEGIQAYLKTMKESATADAIKPAGEAKKTKKKSTGTKKKKAIKDEI